MIHICYGLYDKDGRYSKFVGTSITSIFENTNSDVTVHILHDNTLSEENRDNFVYIAGHYSQTIKFYNVEKLVPEKIAELREKMGAVENTQYSIGTLYRLLIPSIFSKNISKIIYLDADTIVNLDIKELWQIELGEKPLGAVAEIGIAIWHSHNISNHYLIKNEIVRSEDYFNGGVLLLNLNQLRNKEQNFSEGIKFIIEHDCEWFDQDIFNYCFSKNYLKIPAHFDVFISDERVRKGNVNPSRKIYHYVSDFLKLDCQDTLNRLWFEYFSKTPWFNFKMINNIYDGIKQLYIEQKNFAVQVSKFVAGKNRVFFVEKNYINAAKNIFGIEDSEKIISANDSDSLKKLTEIIREGNNFLFILTNNYTNIHLTLVNNGFIPGKDFINAWIFLSDAHGVPLNTNPIVMSL